MLLALDPGTQNTGWAILDNHGVVIDSGTWVRPSDVPPSQAVVWMGDKLVDLMDKYEDMGELVVEAYYPFGGKPNKNTTNMVMLVGMLMGLAYGHKLNVNLIAPKVWKDWARDQGYTQDPDSPHSWDAETLGEYWVELQNSHGVHRPPEDEPVRQD